jgi:hypothetical protein
MVVWWRKLAGQRKQTPHKTRPPRGRQGAGAKRKLVQLQKDAAASEQCTSVKSMQANAGINQVVRNETKPRRRQVVQVVYHLTEYSLECPSLERHQKGAETATGVPYDSTTKTKGTKKERDSH